MLKNIVNKKRFLTIFSFDSFTLIKPVCMNNILTFH